MDASPLLGYSMADDLLRSRRLVRHAPPPLRGAARLLRRASGRRMRLREPSFRVRENAAEELEERQSYWAYSKPVIVLDLLWNLAFVCVGFTVMGLSMEEKPVVPLRIWVVGYILQCVVHVGCVVVEYRRRREVGFGEVGWGSGGSGSLGTGSDVEDYGSEQGMADDETSVTKHLESANTMFAFIWWVIGFYWVTDGGQTLLCDSPHLYWLCVTFLAFDMLFVVICVAVACLVGIAVCCCLPCIIAILYAVTDQNPVIVLDLLWNLAFVCVGFTVMGLSMEEKPMVPLRIWVVGYILHCVVHVMCVVVEYRRRREVGFYEVGWGSGGSGSLGSRCNSFPFLDI